MALVCLPGAGGSARRYLRWREELAPWAGVVPLDLPGRGAARRAPVCGSLTEAAEALLPTVLTLGRWAVFGHSLGALLGFELARQAAAADAPPAFLVAAACRAPGETAPSLHRALDVRDEDGFAAALAESGVLGPGRLGSPLTWRFLPELRHDLGLGADYAPPGAAQLPVPVHAWYATGDPLVPGSAALGWSGRTTLGCTVRSFHGGHCFPEEQTAPTVRALRAVLAAAEAALDATPAGALAAGSV